MRTAGSRARVGLALSISLPLAFLALPRTSHAMPQSSRGADRAQTSPQRRPEFVCADGLIDQATGNCIPASSVPTLGSLFPISQDLFVSTNGNVGIGTTFPNRALEVVGAVGVARSPGAYSVVVRPSNNTNFGVIETIAYVPGSPPPSGFPQVTTLTSTVSIDQYAGAVATVNKGDFLVALTTPAIDSKSGFVSVFNRNVEIAGINGNTGIVFGTAKSFVQPHPSDPTKEIQYVSLEGPEHGVYARGTARLVSGVATIELPPTFRMVAREEGMTVSLTPLGPSRGLYVSLKSLESVVVQENEGGAGDVEFDYLVMGERSAMPHLQPVQPNTHFLPQPGTMLTAGSLPGEYRRLLIQNGILNADGSVNAANAASLGWTRRGQAWTGGQRASAGVAEH